MKKMEFVLCIDKGYFERQAKLLISSIRKIGNRHKNAPIYCYQPRKRYKISKSTKKFLEEHEVEFIDLELNKKFKYFIFANKNVVCAHREENSNSDVIFYLDCDTILLNDPECLSELEKGEVIIRAEDAKGIGTTVNFDDHFSAHWKMLYRELNVKQIRSVYSIMDHIEMLAHYNAGQIVTARENGLFSQWNENMTRLLTDKKIERDILMLCDQTILSATVSQMELAVKSPDIRFNFPVNLFAFDEIKNPMYHQVDFQNLITLHYHKVFLRGLNPIEAQLNSFKNGQIMNELIIEHGLMNPFKESLSFRVRKKLDKLIAKQLYCNRN